MRLVVPLTGAVTDLDDPKVAAATLGGKGFALLRLIRCGLPVPSAAVVPVQVFMDHVGRLAGGWPPTAGPELQGGVAGMLLSPDLTKALGRVEEGVGPGPWAVRSSATTEDGTHWSCAGQFHTELGVDCAGLADALRRVWASALGEGAAAYAAGHGHQGPEGSPPGMAVVIQRQVAGRVAGVLFTCDPLSGDTARVVIEAAPGLGEALVAGRVSPDRWVLRRDTLQVVERVRGGGAELSRGELEELVRLGLQVEGLEGGPQDVEWALTDEGIHLLQARPVTRIGVPPWRQADRQVWTNVNAAEVLPDVVTPATWSIVEPVVERLLGRVLRNVGISLGGAPILGRVAGRACFNLNTLLAIVRSIPMARDEDLILLLGGHHDMMGVRPRDDEIPPVRRSLLRFMWGIPGQILRWFSLTPTRGRAILARMRDAADAEARIDPLPLAPAELVQAIRRTLVAIVDDDGFLDLLGMGRSFDIALYGLCRRWLGPDGHGLASRMLAGAGGNANADAGLALWALAAEASAAPGLRRAVLDAADEDELCRELGGTEPGALFLKGWSEFFRRHGHHCRGELELGNPRWSEARGEILAQVRTYVGALDEPGGDFRARYDGAVEERQRVEAEMRRRLGWGLRSWILGRVLVRARAMAPLRESLKSEAVRRLAHVRRCLLELGRRLVRQERLMRTDDVFFLGLDELEPVVADLWEPDEARRRVAERRRQYEADAAVVPPAVVRGRFDPHLAYLEDVSVVDELVGVAVNPGVVVGRARVVLRSGDDTVRAGEVLIAPFTDPGWTPWFLNAAAIVTDLGGILSHGSVVAREFGIPAVVNVGDATRRIRTGQLVEVDGGRGTVRIIDEVSPAP